MQMSQTIGELSKALSKFQAKAISIKRTGDNPFFKSEYLTLDDLLRVVLPVLSECGLSVSQLPSGDGLLTTILMHESGEYLMSEANTAPKSHDPQAFGSGITYFRRYMLASILGIASEKDDDGNIATQQPVQENYSIQENHSSTPNCSKCGKQMILKPAGVSKAGRAYGAFWSCKGKRPDGTWCNNTLSLDVKIERSEPVEDEINIEDVPF